MANSDINDTIFLKNVFRLNYFHVKLDKQYQRAKDIILEKFEVEYIEYNLALIDGNISKTVLICLIDRRRIPRLINKYNIQFKEK
ncbi:MAG: hypothetical protein V1773_19735 [bacterium]